MLNQNLYRLFIYSNNGSLAGVLKDYREFSYGEKKNGFINCEIQMNANRLPNWVIKNFKTGCSLIIQRKKKGKWYKIWGGIMTNKKDWETNSQNIRNQVVKFKHFGQDFFDNVPITKNYSAPTDEGLILSDIILYAQNPSNWANLPVPVIVTPSEIDFGISIGSVELTNNLKTFDFSKKTVSVGKAIEQIIDTKDAENSKKQFSVGPNFSNNEIKEFSFYKDYQTSAKASFSGQSGTGLQNFTRQNIVKIKTTAPDFKNVIIGQGDGITVASRSSVISSILKTNKARYKEESFKNITDTTVLQNLSDKALSKNENPVRLVEIDLMTNESQIGNFGQGDKVRINWRNSDDPDENIDSEYFVYEITIKYTNLGKETVSLKVAMDDPAEIERGGKKLLYIIKQTQNKLQILEQN